MFTLAITVGSATRAAGQTTRAPVDLSVGYQVLHIPDETFPFGLNFDASGEVMPGLKVVGEFGWARDEQSVIGDVNSTLNFFNLGGGPRWSITPATAGTRTIEPYVQFLIGAVHARRDLTAGSSSLEQGNWAFMLQPGAGVAVPFSPNVAVLGQFDYRRAFFEDGENEVRFVIGLRIGRP